MKKGSATIAAAGVAAGGAASYDKLVLAWLLPCPAPAAVQHEEIAKFAAWARKQRVSSKADVGAKHFRYRR